MAKLFEGHIVGHQGSQLYMNTFNWFYDGSSLTTINDLSFMIAQKLGVDPNDLSEPFDGSFLHDLMTHFAIGGGLDQIYIRDVYNVNDFFVTPLSGTGWSGAAAAATALSSIMAATATSSRTRQDIRAGQKRLPAPQEASVDGYDGALTAGALADIQVTMDILDDGLDITISLVNHFFANAIVKKEKYTTPSGKKAAKYYADPEVQFTKIAYPVTWTVNPYVSSQDTRKRGRGR